MIWSYEYTPYLWPAVASVAFITALVINAVRHRAAPGAIPFITLLAMIMFWVLANALELAGTEGQIKIVWFKFKTAVAFPTVIAAMCFALDYAGLGRWLTRRTISVLAVPPLVFALLTLTNDAHHLVWVRIWFDGYVRADIGPASWCALLCAYSMSALHLVVLVWLFAHSPRHRWVAAGLILAPFIMRATHFTSILNWNPVAPLDPMVVAANVALLPYSLAVFGFRMFDVVPVARDTVIERMVDGMMVIDAENRIVDVNPSARAVFGTGRSKVVGGRVEEVLHACPDLVAFLAEPGAAQREVALGNVPARWYQVSVSPLVDRRGFQLGRLVSLHDITEQKQAQAQILDQQRTLAMLKEREMLAQELHDGIGQTLAAAYLEVKSATVLLARGETGLAESCLHHLAEVTRKANESVREYLRGVRIRSSPDQALLAGLRRYLAQYSYNYGIHTKLVASPELEEKWIDSTVEAQLQSIIQEALTNVRKHSGASSARVSFVLTGGEIRVTVEDDGRGFDPEAVDGTRGFGLRSMRGRAEGVGARIEIDSSPGKGTRVVVQAPRQVESI
jgi:PAS domain S-box-containing protein